MKMRWALPLVAALAAVLVLSAPVLAAPIVRTAALTGAAEVPGPGDPDGRGAARISITTSKNRLCYSVRVSNIEPARMAHIHRGRAGVAGPIVITLRPPTNGFSSGCVTVGRNRLLDIARNPSLYYVNVHNTPFPGGAVRGQLRVP